MRRILQQKTPEDFVLATGKTRTVREFTILVFETLNIPLEWSGSGDSEIGTEINSGKVLVKVQSKYFRPTEVDLLVGNPSKAKKILGWEPKVTFEELSRIMANSDWEKVKKQGF